MLVATWNPATVTARVPVVLYSVAAKLDDVGDKGLENDLATENG